jgi:hypothetical protein
MHWHLMLRGKRTTITVDKVTAVYLLAKIGGYAATLGIDSKAGKAQVRKWIQRRVNDEEAYLPEKNISQWVQSRIIHEIVDPALRSAFDKTRENLLTKTGD